MCDALSDSEAARRSRVLNIDEPLRTGRVHYAPQTLWLLRSVVTETSRERIEDRVGPDFVDSINAGAPDARDLVTIAGRVRKVPVTALRGFGPRPGLWVRRDRITGLPSQVATEILQTPQDWPSGIVALAAEQQAKHMAKRVKPLLELARLNKWPIAD
jgi:hypothetical protein